MAEHNLKDPNAITPGDSYQYGRYTVIRKMTQGGQGIVVLVKDNTDQVE
jgi:hypothetical protein